MHIPHNEKSTDITGVLLAGGRSRRMGCDKAQIEVAGRPLFVYPLEFLLFHFDSSIIAGNKPNLAPSYVQAVPDIYPGSALGGLYTALLSAQTDWIFVLPCDLPYPDHRILKLLIGLREGSDAVIPKTPKGYEPIFALYNKRCLPHMEAMLKDKQFRISDFYKKVNVTFLDWQQMPPDWERSLMNINTPEQLEQLHKEQE